MKLGTTSTTPAKSFPPTGKSRAGFPALLARLRKILTLSLNRLSRNQFSNWLQISEGRSKKVLYVSNRSSTYVGSIAEWSATTWLISFWGVAWWKETIKIEFINDENHSLCLVSVVVILFKSRRDLANILVDHNAGSLKSSITTLYPGCEVNSSRLRVTRVLFANSLRPGLLFIFQGWEGYCESKLSLLREQWQNSHYWQVVKGKMLETSFSYDTMYFPLWFYLRKWLTFN